MLIQEYNKKCTIYIAASLTLITFLVYVRVGWHDFINYDDPFIVTMNENIHDGFTLNAIRWAFTTQTEGNWIPLSWMSHLLDIQLFGMNPGAHHLISVLWHIASTLLLFKFFYMTTGEQWKSAMVAFLFALHPLHVESVAWVAERKDVLSGFFCMLTLCFYASYVGGCRLLCYFSSLVSFTLGLLAKPMLVSLPLILLLLDFWPLGRFDKTSGLTKLSELKRLLLEKIPFVSLAILVSLITYFTQKAGGTISENYTLISRTGKALVYYTTYLHKTVWPVGLAVFYPGSFFPPPIINILGSAFILITVTLTAILLKKRYGFILVGWLWYLITLLPVIGLVQIGSHSIADRYTYIPLIGVFVIVVWGVSDIMNGWRTQKLLLCVLSIALVVIMMVLTSRQLSYWKNSITLFSHAIEVTENNHVAHTNLGNALLQEGRYQESLQYLQLAVQERPADTFALMNLGNAYSHLNEHEKAVDSYLRILLVEPRSNQVHYELAVEYLIIGQQKLAIEQYNILRQYGSGLSYKLLKKIISSNANMEITH